VPIVDAGFVTGPPRFADNQVRYVLDDSPAAGAGIQVGDKILAVNGRQWIGVESFAGYAGKPVSIAIEREGKRF
jgi:C-terminal processing protease CtpA/Prc